MKGSKEDEKYDFRIRQKSSLYKTCAKIFPLVSFFFSYSDFPYDISIKISVHLLISKQKSSRNKICKTFYKRSSTSLGS